MIDDLWYKSSIIYCLSVGTFMDANADGIGDFKGLLRRLDYLQGLGISAIWLMPFQPSRHSRHDSADLMIAATALEMSAWADSHKTPVGSQPRTQARG